MSNVNPTLIDQVETFTQSVLLPVLEDIQHSEDLTNQNNFIIIISAPLIQNDAANILLTQIHPGKPHNPQTLTQTIAAQGWIGPSLYIETIRDAGEGQPPHHGKYCLSLEFTLDTAETLYITPISGYAWAAFPSLSIHTFDPAYHHQTIQNLDEESLFNLFSESFQAFEQQAPQLELEINLNETLSLPPPQPLNVPISSDQVRQLTLQLSPPGFPLTIKLNRTLKTLTEIKATKDRYGYSNNLFLEYSPQATESDVVEQSTRLSHYQFLRYLAHLHRFLQEQILNWHQQNGQPSAGSSSLSLQQSITQLGEQLRQRIQDLTETQLQSHAAVELQEELDHLSADQQQQKTYLEQIEQNPLLGYLDFHFLERGHCLQLHQFFNASDRPIDIYPQYLKRQDSPLFLSRIESCHSAKYQSYWKRYKDGLDPTHFVEYAIAQKLYPNRPISVGPASTPAYPRLEWLWGAMDLPTLSHNSLTQIWRIFPMSCTDPPQWLIIAATVDGESLKSIGLENGQIAQEGTSEYLGRSLQLMSQTDDEYTCTLSKLVREAFEQKRLKYLHFHQTQNLETGEPRDIVQFQFQLYT